MSAPLRVIDTGQMPARWNVAVTAALAELHIEGRIADTLRFHRYPAAVLLGRNQALHEAVSVENCMRDGVEIARRVTGGGAVYMSPGALAWDLVIHRRALGSRLADISRTVGEAVAAAFRGLGLGAQYRQENEIAVAGRKICGMSGYRDGDTIVYQSTALVSADLSDMARYLLLPSTGSREVLRDLAARVATVHELLGRTPDCAELISAIAGNLSRTLNRDLNAATLQPQERERAGKLHRLELGQDRFVYGSAPAESGKAHDARGAGAPMVASVHP